MSNNHQIHFMGIGAVKCGSSWINNILLQHPQIDIPKRKELTYFNRFDISGIDNPHFTHDLDFYYNFWDFSEPNRIRGEFSPQYLTDTDAPHRIKDTFPAIKLIAILRNPIQRALSHVEYDQHFNGIIDKKLTPLQAFKKHPYLLEAGNYAKHLDRWMQVFDRKNIHLILLEEAIVDPKKTAENLFDFLGTDCPPQLDFSAVNERKEIKSPSVAKLLKIPGKIDKTLDHLGPWKKVKQSGLYASLLDAKTSLVDKNAQKREKQEVDAEVIEYLKKYYASPNQALTNVLNMNLSCWK